MPRFGKSGTCALLLVAAVTLTACQVTATGTGTVTITSDEVVTRKFNGTSPYVGNPGNTGKVGDILAFCAPGVTCVPTDGSILYWFTPEVGATQAVFSAGTEVLDPAGNGVPLPAGTYHAVGIRYETTFWDVTTGTADFIISGSGPDLTTSMQSTARASADAACATGWNPSWAQWPNNGTGGYVCNRWIYIYYPDLPVPSQHPSSTAQPWHQEIGRVSSQAPCPAGYNPGWSQWPNNNTGGYVCARDVVSYSSTDESD